MRLTQLRLSGFKSFVDPTQLQVSRQLVGIVGPNGCGKSNVIDAVRWVLGESRAAELRGENMHDVIFNGSSTRKPAGRASVELIFDNSAGRLGGPWGRYAELSVKRVLSRDGQSTYQINGQNVRRKDVYDVFLGTGLGPRAYAIIGQGMISRVIESKPEELRVFLEEAAGVSKYRERRRETENRLSDARDNLARVDDIRQELTKRIEQLEAQAQVAEVFQNKSSERQSKQALLLAVRRHESELSRSAQALERSRLLTDLEQQQAELRHLELEIEQARQALEVDQAQSQEVQAELYEINTAVARQEVEDKNHSQAKERASATLSLSTLTLERLVAEEDELRSALAEQESALERHLSEIMRLEALVTETREQLNPQEESRKEQETSLQELRAVIATLQVDQRGNDARLQELISRRDTLEAHIERKSAERGTLERMDPTALASIRVQQEEAQSLVASAQAKLEETVGQIATAQQEQEQARADLQQADQRLATQVAERSAQESLLAAMESQGGLLEWTRSQSWAKEKMLWAGLKVEEGWQVAVGAMLESRLTAIPIESLNVANDWTSLKPPERLTVFERNESVVSPSPRDAGMTPLAMAVRGDDAGAAMARLWLAGMFQAKDFSEAMGRRNALQANEMLVTPEGLAVGRTHITIPGDSKADHSALLGQRDRVRDLAASVRSAEIQQAEAAARLAERDQALVAMRQAREAAQQTIDRAMARAHELDLTAVRLQEKATRLEAAEKEIDRSILEAQAELDGLVQRLQEMGRVKEDLVIRLAGLAEQSAETEVRLTEAESKCRGLRESLSAAQSSLQEARLEERTAEGQANSVRTQIDDLARRRQEALDRQTASQRELTDAEAALLQSQLQTLLEKRVEVERRLSQARAVVDASADRLRTMDESRLAIERKAIPLRESMSAVEVAIASATATIEQIEQQIADTNIDLETVTAQWEGGMPPPGLPRPSSLQADINRLAREIEALGPVNLAALSELEQSREREGFLNSQAADLTEAVETLEDAIRKIDRESRALLQDTYDTVNQNFSRLFPTLFGGGEARLVLTGDEILDAGVQVMAQPPGKKNATIHLLSGGEKALTATALVFALFQLNPAPFCMLDEVDAPLDDPNTERLCNLVREMSGQTQFIFITHNKISMALAEHLVGVTMQELGVSRLVAVDLDAASALVQEAA